MNLSNFYKICGVLLIGLAIGCTDEPIIDNSSSNDSNILPLAVGSYWDYRMDSITYDNFGLLIQEKSGYLRESVIDVSVNSDGDSVFVLEVSRKKNFNDSWIAEKLIRLEKNGFGINRIEDNLLFFQLVLPATEGTEWGGIQFDESNVIEVVEGELLLPYTQWEYKVLARDASLMVGQEEKNDLIQIQEADSENFIERRFSNAYYEQGVGLVYRNKIILDTQCINVDPDCVNDPWEEKADKGYYLEQTLIDHG